MDAREQNTSELEELLTDIKGDGEVESEGQFTIDPKMALEKLRGYQLPNPEMYIVQLVSSAVIAQAAKLEISTTRTTLTFRFDGLVPSGEDLEKLERSLFPALRPEPLLKEMSVGLEAAARLAKKVVVESRTTAGCWRWVRNGKTAVVDQLNEAGVQENVCIIQVEKGLALQSLVQKHHPELDWLQACCHAPLEIWIDEQRRNWEPVPKLPDETIIWTRLTRPNEESPVLESRPPSLRLEHKALWGQLALVPQEVAQQHGLVLVVQGLSIHRPLRDLGFFVICGVVHVSGLKKNLSHTDIVEDEDYDDIKRFLRTVAISTIAEYCRQSKEYSPFWYHLLPTVTRLLQEREAPPKDEEAIRAWARLTEERSRGGSPFSVLEKAKSLAAEGRHRESRQILNHLFRNTSGKALEKFDAGEIDHLGDSLELLRLISKEDEPMLSERFGQAENLFWSLKDQTADLSGNEGLDDPLYLHRQGLLHRWHGNLIEAGELHVQAIEHDRADEHVKAWGLRYAAELEFESACYEQASELLILAAELIPKHRDLREEQAFLERMLPHPRPHKVIKYLKLALAGTEVEPFVRWLLLEELARMDHSSWTFHQWAQYKAQRGVLARSLRAERKQRAGIEGRLERNYDLLGWESPWAVAQLKISAVLDAESEYGPTHLYTRYCRRRCVYQLHRLGLRTIASRMQCRGHILEHLRLLLAHAVTIFELLSGPGPEEKENSQPEETSH